MPGEAAWRAAGEMPRGEMARAQLLGALKKHANIIEKAA